MPGCMRSGIFAFGAEALRWLGLIAALFLPRWALAECLPSGALLDAQVAAVVDGDTLKMSDGRKVRLLNINTPELGHGVRQDEAYARRAKQAVETWLTSSRRVFIKVYGTDRYDRQLAEVYLRADGQLVTELLLRAGLGWRIYVPPQSRDRPCLYQAEDEARRHKRGLWSQPLLDSSVAKKSDQGFRLIRGRIDKVTESRQGIWLDLDGDVVLHITRADLDRFADIDLQRWRGHVVEVRGWLRSRKPPKPAYASLRMDLRHPAMIRVLDQR